MPDPIGEGTEGTTVLRRLVIRTGDLLNALWIHTNGLYDLIISDSCSLYTTGALTSGASSPIPGFTQYMIGATSDIAGAPDSANVALRSNDITLDQIALRYGGEAKSRLRFKSTGDAVWSDGTTERVSFVQSGSGLKIGSAASEKLGLWGVVPVVQPSAIADTSGANLVAVEAEVNKVKAALRAAGLIAT